MSKTLLEIFKKQEDYNTDDLKPNDVAVLMCMDADYDSPNFLWFRQRYERFVYVDRVVTAGAARGRGLAGRLYRELVERARGAGHERIVCEVNADPPNPGSEAFHRKFGFRPVGLRPRYYTDDNEDALVMTTPRLEMPEMQDRLARLRAELGEAPA